MHPLQRFSPVFFAGIYWFISTSIVVSLYCWISGYKGSLWPPLISILLAGIAGMMIGATFSVVSFFVRVTGSVFQRIAVGAFLGVLFAALLSAIGLPETSLVFQPVFRDIYFTMSGYVTAPIVMGCFGVATPRRIFFGVTYHASPASQA